jgi:hypothetical protein
MINTVHHNTDRALNIDRIIKKIQIAQSYSVTEVERSDECIVISKK